MYIYSLTDPFTDKVRYIGKTCNLKSRFNKHIKESVNAKTHKECWIKGLLSRNVLPIMDVLDHCDSTDVDFWEIHYISLFKSWGINLLNMTEGGDGAKKSEESKKRISGLCNPKSLPVAQICIKTGSIISVFASTSIAEKKVDAPTRALIRYFRDANLHGGGYEWIRISKEQYLELYNLYDNGVNKYQKHPSCHSSRKRTIEQVIKVTKVKKTVQRPNIKPIVVSKDNLLIHFDSISEAARVLNLNKSNIHKVLTKTSKTTGSYFFEYNNRYIH